MSIGTRRKGKSVRWDNLRIPQDISDRVTRLYYDHNCQRIIYGARSQLVTDLLRAWLEHVEKKTPMTYHPPRHQPTADAILE